MSIIVSYKQNYNMKYLASFSTLLFSIIIIVVFFLNIHPAFADNGFQQWVADFEKTAVAKGISPQTYQQAFAGTKTPDNRVLKKARYQPEFTTEIWDYLDLRVNSQAVVQGRRKLQIYKSTLEQIENQYGVPASIILAIWSMETNYGGVLSKTGRLHYVPGALATLAYGDKKRRKFAESQLIAALQILEQGDITTDKMSGSWAGAMGHTQFIPTSYLAYGVDMDGNGRRDIWHSVPDALATAANLLKQNKWQSGKTWGYEIISPTGGEKYIGETKTLAQWQKLGFARINKKKFNRLNDNAVLKMPTGPVGPSFLMLKNFFVIKRYNNSDYYALAVGHLSDRIAGYSNGFHQQWPKPKGMLSIEDCFELQKLLQFNGFYDGEIDGNVGSGTRKAIMAFQKQRNMVPDGLPKKDVLKALQGI